MAKIDIEKFICSLIERSGGINQQIFHSDLISAIKEQGLEYKNGEIIKTQRRIAAEAKEALYSEPVTKVSDKVWSEEDEEELGIAIKYLQRAGQWDSATWLKSLKTRLKGE